jgi:hypothetical protein
MEIEQEEGSYDRFYDFLEKTINKIKLQKPVRPPAPFTRFCMHKECEAKEANQPIKKEDFGKDMEQRWQQMDERERLKYFGNHDEQAEEYRRLCDEHRGLKSTRTKVSPFQMFYQRHIKEENDKLKNIAQASKHLTERWREMPDS